MKKPSTLLTCIIAIVFISVGYLTIKAFNSSQSVTNNYQTFYLNTNRINKADTAAVNSNYNSYIIKSYKYKGKRDKTGANAFIYVIQKDSLGLNVDTVLLLDKRLDSKRVENIEDYYHVVNPKTSSKGCTVTVPQEQISSIKKYKFIYADVDFISED